MAPMQLGRICPYAYSPFAIFFHIIPSLSMPFAIKLSICMLCTAVHIWLKQTQKEIQEEKGREKDVVELMARIKKRNRRLLKHSTNGYLPGYSGSSWWHYVTGDGVRYYNDNYTKQDIHYVDPNNLRSGCFGPHWTTAAALTPLVSERGIVY